MLPPRIRFLILLLVPGVCLASEPVDFTRDVRPLLADRCFSCHGPDEQSRKARLRLDLRDAALAPREGRSVIDVDQPDRSLLLERILSDDPGERMPPPEAHKDLTATEIETLRRWIEQGAPWDEHWAFVAPERPAVPAPDHPWARNAVDAFVRASLEAAGRAPSPEADRRTLIRRVTLDLTGLPPTLEEIEAFLADDDADAYERVVDRLLASPHFGERLALRWLDLARYADTNGYSIDGGRHMWAWRDGVIDAFNRNQRFDEFTIEQLAGDLLPDATTRQRIASGFNRNHMNTHEGGTIAEEYRVAYVADRVKTTAQTWMGLTMGCAQCHDHKYDPISQKEYYRFFAYFNTITDRGNDGNGGVNSVPFIPVFSAAQKEELAELEADLARKQRAFLAPVAEVDRAQAAWEAEEREIEREPLEVAPWSLVGPFTGKNGNQVFERSYGPEETLDLETSYEDGKLRWKSRPDLVDGKPHALQGARSAWYLHRTITSNRADSLELSFGSDDAIRVWWRGELVLDRNVRRGVAPDQERVTVTMPAGSSDLLVKIVNDGGPGGFYFKVLRAGPPKLVLEAMAREASTRGEDDDRIVRSYFRSLVPELEPQREALAAVEKQMEAIRKAPVTTAMVMEEMAMPRETYVLVRGQYDQRGEKVSVGTPDCLPPLSDDAPANRLGLARWLVDDRHPLTARVTVNGFWQMLFGMGLVRTSEDFGTRGELPSHPELLDWLAVEFREQGWDVKGLIRLLVTSSTYRQSSDSTPELTRRDPQNRLLARGPRFRLPAEFVRDQALAASGLLVPEIGGPSVRPYQPPGLWEEMSHFGSTPATEQLYRTDSGNKLYRRSLYTIWKRTVPPPPMVVFDAPNRELCVARRARTNTPLQALVLLNETGFVEAARALGERVLRARAGTAERLAHAFEIVTGRVPDETERSILRAALDRELAYYGQHPEAAESLLSVGESPRDPALDPAEHAAWTVVAQLLLNLSETITKP